MASYEPVARRRKEIGYGGRSRWGRSEVAAAAAATPFMEWKKRGGESVGRAVAAVSARKLAASLWWLAATTNGDGSVRWQCGISFNRLGFEFCSSMPIPKFAAEGVTKWDYFNSKAWDDSYFQSNVKLTSATSARQAELFKPRKQVNELEAKGGRLRTIRGCCMKKLNEESASCMRTQHQKMCSVIKNLADGVKREKKNCRKIDIMNSKLLRDIAEAKLSGRSINQNLENEKKVRAELENVLYDLVKEIEGNKAEIVALRNQQKRIQLEVEEERKMLQIAELWREEQAQMKLADAKSILEDKYAEISNLIADLKALLRRLSLNGDVNVMSIAEVLRQDFNSVDMQGVKNFTFKFPRSDKAFAITKDSQTNEAERSASRCFSHDRAHYASIVHRINPEVNDACRKSTCSNGLTGHGSGFEATIGTETVNQAEIYPSRRHDESEGSVNKIRRKKNMSNFDTELNNNAHHGPQKSEASEISSISLVQSKKKGSSAFKIQRSLPRNKDTRKTIMVDGSSNRSISSVVSMASPQRESGEKALNIRRNPHVVRAMKGHIEWPRDPKARIGRQPSRS